MFLGCALRRSELAALECDHTEGASVVVGDLLEQWPSLRDLQRVKLAKLEKFLRDHHCSDIPEGLIQIRQAIPATHDRALLDSAPYLVAAWVRQMAVLRESIRQLEKRIAELAAQQEDWHIFQSLPGAGAVLAPRLMVALGTQRDRYSSAGDLQSFSGIAGQGSQRKLAMGAFPVGLSEVSAPDLS